MASKLITAHELSGKRVMSSDNKKEKMKKVGKVRCCVFHPREKRCVGFIVKRPDLLLMFHRKDLFVSLRGYDMEDGRIVLHKDSAATGSGACKDLGVDYDECVLWEGLPVMTADGESFGHVGNITFDQKTGVVDSVECETGAVNSALLGVMTVPSEYILGFKRGIGEALAPSGEEAEEQEEAELGALLVSDEVKNLTTEGGAAEEAGKATAVIGNKVSTAVEDAKPAVSEAVDKGATAVGKQLGKASHMFDDFQDEYNKARWGDVGGEEAAKKKAAAAKKKAAQEAAAEDAEDEDHELLEEGSEEYEEYEEYEEELEDIEELVEEEAAEEEAAEPDEEAADEEAGDEEEPAAEPDEEPDEEPAAEEEADEGEDDEEEVLDEAEPEEPEEVDEVLVAEPIEEEIATDEELEELEDEADEEDEDEEDKEQQEAYEAVERGAYAVGKQFKRASHMFSDFKDEFDKASK